jgi:hypothetical protein
MAFGITNKIMPINTPGAIQANIGSTGLNQILGTATTTSTATAASRWEYGDYTTTQGWVPATSQAVSGGIGDHGFAHLQYRALVSLKQLTYGTATSTFSLAGLLVTLEAATSTAGYVGTGSTGTAINQFMLDSKVVPLVSTTSTGTVASFYLFGTVPVIGGAQFARVGMYNLSGATVTTLSTALDVIIEGM